MKLSIEDKMMIKDNEERLIMMINEVVEETVNLEG